MLSKPSRKYAATPESHLTIASFIHTWKLIVQHQLHLRAARRHRGRGESYGCAVEMEQFGLVYSAWIS